MAAPGANLIRVVSAWVAMSQRDDAAGLGELLAEDVFWQGLEPELRCRNRGEVLERLFHRGRAPRLTRFEAREEGDAVVVTVDGPDLAEPGPAGITGARTLRFEFQDGVIRRIDSLGAAAAPAS